ncbi:MAG: DNA polymerase III subunit gamma/tau [Burkholderiales bacterium]|nr:DNA polymerase III subunit gamma/tau [Burkholderiales bacterium]
MSYQALARKWRPATFAELSGQEHVVKALTNSLERGRLHHAYLLTGTRGVGKTTIARILAKSLNCAQGVTVTPCGVCTPCRDIDAGRFVDLLELDAASNTGIDDMRAILDNARYAPTVGRYKVYLIDEVHQLSKAAFNSMLKTLEEPPEHVRFVLATTDPQKIPITVLSRCLQFNLKPLTPQLIAARLAFIVEAEAVASDPAAVALLAAAGRGSLRDSLSLLDQAIAFGGGEVREDVVRTMLGTVDREYAYRIADALAANDGTALLAESDALAERGLAALPALDEIASLFHRIAVAQVVPAAAGAFDDAERVRALAARFTPEAAQLHYQIATQSRADVARAPDEAAGMTMALLRMLAFAPIVDGDPEPPGAPARAARGEATGASGSASAPKDAAAASASTPQRPAPATRARGGRHAATEVPAAEEAAPPPRARPEAPAAAEAAGREMRPLPTEPDAWPAFVASLKLTGMAAQLAAQTGLVSLVGHVLTLALPVSARHLTDKVFADKLTVALDKATGRKLRLAFEVGVPASASLADTEQRKRAEARVEREAAFRDEPFVRDLVARFDAAVRTDTIAPLADDGEAT